MANPSLKKNPFMSMWLSGANKVAGAARGFGSLVGRLLEWPPLLYLGKISYGVYLIHNFSVPLLRIVFPRCAVAPPAWMAAAAVPTTIGLAALSWHFVEKPFNRLKSRFL